MNISSTFSKTFLPWHILCKGTANTQSRFNRIHLSQTTTPLYETKNATVRNSAGSVRTQKDWRNLPVSIRALLSLVFLVIQSEIKDTPCIKMRPIWLWFLPSGYIQVYAWMWKHCALNSYIFLMFTNTNSITIFIYNHFRFVGSELELCLILYWNILAEFCYGNDRNSPSRRYF